MHILFTSVNGVHCAASVCGEAFHPTFSKHPIAAVGEKTAEALEAYGLQTMLLPKTSSQEGLVEAYCKQGIPASLLFFRAVEGRDHFSEQMRKLGCDVQLAPIYETVCPTEDATAAKQALAANEIDAVLLGSSKTASHYVQRIGDLALADTPVIACISPKVAEHTEKHLGLSVQVVAKEASFASMLDGLEHYFADTQ